MPLRLGSIRSSTTRSTSGSQRALETGSRRRLRTSTSKPLAPQPPLDEVDDPRLVLHHQDHGADHRLDGGRSVPLRVFETFLTARSGASLAVVIRLEPWFSRNRPRWRLPRAAAASAARALDRLLGGGTDGNEQLTAVAGVILLVLFAVLGITIIRIGQLLWLAPVPRGAARRACRAQAGEHRLPLHALLHRQRRYRRKGPPHPLMRMLGPFVIL